MNNPDIYGMIIGATIVLLILLCFIISFVFIYKSRQNRYQLEMKEAKEQYKQEILTTQLEIKEQTLRMISQELHDNFGQVLSLAILSLSAIEFNDPANGMQKVENISELLRRLVQDLRDLSKSLDSENISKAGLPAIIKFEMDMLEKTGVYKVSFQMNGIEQRLEASRETVVYRMVQESLNNIIKHAKASSIAIELNYLDDMLYIDITDDGKGFDMNAVNNTEFGKTGAGLSNMKKRAALINARFDITSTPVTGTAIKITIPFVLQTP